MGLIKRNRIEETGFIEIKKKEIAPPVKKPLAIPKPSAVNILPAQQDIPAVKSEAQKIIEAAEGEADAIRSEAVAEGREEGKAEAAEKIKEALGTLNRAVNERKQIIKDAESEILRLSLKVAEQIIRSEVSLHRDVCLNIVAEAISRVSDREQIIVRVNHDDAEHLKRYKDRLAGLLDGVKSFSIIEDPNVEAGGCLVETNLGFIDSRISTKIKSIEEALKKTEQDEH
ncbi:MAG: FliH/SctL family protein [Candidatus Margulisbacteria bacterium]|nr:FliH/SctL family protein [Candidatus Margulisiibacteriota bacterium]